MMDLRIAQGVSPSQGFIPLEELFIDEEIFHPCSTRDDDTWAIIYTTALPVIQKEPCSRTTIWQTTP